MYSSCAQNGLEEVGKPMGEALATGQAGNSEGLGRNQTVRMQTRGGSEGVARVKTVLKCCHLKENVT